PPSGPRGPSSPRPRRGARRHAGGQGGACPTGAESGRAGPFGPRRADATTADPEQALADLRAALAAEDVDPVVLGAAVTAATKASVDKEEIAAAKRVLFQLQKEKREQAKRERAHREALEALSAAQRGDDAAALQEALSRADGAGCGAEETAEARLRLEELQKAEKEDIIRYALEDFEYAVGQDDVENATLALQDAMDQGADPEEVKKHQDTLRALRERLDPEGEAKARRLAARKDKGARKWNYSGQTDNKLMVNDRFREHEEELQRRRMLAYKGRGRFRDAAEDAGDDAADKEVRKQRAETNKELGYVAPPPKPEVARRGFSYGRSPREEDEPPRTTLTMRAHREMGAGVDLHASWWGMVVDVIDDEPGQPGLRLQDTIVEVSGTSLRELEPEDCEQRFADIFGDGSVATVEPHVQLPGSLNAEGVEVDRDSLRADSERFAADWGVEVTVEEAGSGGHFKILLEGPQSAVKAAKEDLRKMMSFYAGEG
ncbi:unnamed protein product, partial [Prorocentrum cordatum]